MKKREFLNRIVLGSGAILTLPILNVACDDDEEPVTPTNMGNPAVGNGDIISLDLTANDNSKLLNEGGFHIEKNIIVINIDGSSYIALSSVCTHQSCQVSYSPSNKELPCGCHGSTFSTTGSVITGPASSPLRKYSIVLNDNILSVRA